MASGISLANKCQLLFGASVVVILAAALSVPWTRTHSLVERHEREAARHIADSLTSGVLELRAPVPTKLDALLAEDSEPPVVRVSIVRAADIEAADERARHLKEVLAAFRENPDKTEEFVTAAVGTHSVYRYIRPISESAWQALESKAPAPASGPAPGAAPVLPPPGVLIVDRSSAFAAGELLLSRAYIIAAGLVASLLAILVFYFVLTKLILRPVRKLRGTAERLREGDLTIRADISTGDEFEQLSEAFNAMLDRLEQGQAQLRSMNEALDLKVNELAEANVGLFESNRFKSEFLANVSHELRTPLNSIIGFAELLIEIATNDPNTDPKRLRYLNNIRSSGRSLLELINDLLDLAKIEAGRMEVSIEPTSLTDLIEGLAGVMRPQAEAKQIALEIECAADVPMVDTDPGKLQQILYNFLSNAIKFTPEQGRVRLTADRVRRQDNSLGVRIAVSDNGPGIPEDMHEVIFEKFRQADGGYKREHAGTGLGLAICRELAQMLGAEVSFVSKLGEGATFFVDLPLAHQAQRPQPLMAAPA